MQLIAPQGTILHPSVYLIFDEYCHVLLDSKDLAYRKDIEEWRSKILPSNTEFWNDREVTDIENVTAIRILVCGNTGVGKSSLINEVFGVRMVRFMIKRCVPKRILTKQID
jgi:predicted GTPase